MSKLKITSYTPPKYKCEDCHDTGWGGDIGAGIRGNREYAPCHCRPENITVASEMDKLRRQRDELAEVLRDLIERAGFAMHEANNDGAEFDIDDELSDARAALSRIGKEEV